MHSDRRTAQDVNNRICLHTLCVNENIYWHKIWNRSHAVFIGSEWDLHWPIIEQLESHKKSRLEQTAMESIHAPTDMACVEIADWQLVFNAINWQPKMTSCHQSEVNVVCANVHNATLQMAMFKIEGASVFCKSTFAEPFAVPLARLASQIEEQAANTKLNRLSLLTNNKHRPNAWCIRCCNSPRKMN